MGLSTEIVEHQLPMKSECCPVQQKTQESKIENALEDKKINQETVRCRIFGSYEVPRVGSQYSLGPQEGWQSKNVC